MMAWKTHVEGSLCGAYAGIPLKAKNSIAPGNQNEETKVDNRPIHEQFGAIDGLDQEALEAGFDSGVRKADSIKMQTLFS